jgi:hypothetical protein
MMEKIIAKYDYVNGNEESESAIQDDLNSTSTSVLAKGLTLSALRNIVNTFIKKICVKDYVQKVPRYSFIIINHLCVILNYVLLC